MNAETVAKLEEIRENLEGRHEELVEGYGYPGFLKCPPTDMPKWLSKHGFYDIYYDEGGQWATHALVKRMSKYLEPSSAQALQAALDDFEAAQKAVKESSKRSRALAKTLKFNDEAVAAWKPKKKKKHYAVSFGK
jgi:hypothetical protein